MKIDVVQILRKKAPHTKLPRFAINYLRRIIHEEEINRIFEENPESRDLDFISATLDTLNVTTSIIGEEKLPSSNKKYIFVANHPLGGLDGMILGLILGKKYKGKIKLFANDILLFIKPLQNMFIPINKVGSQGRKHANSVVDFFDSDNHLVTFPAGMCSRKVKGEITDMEWKKNFISKAITHQRDIVPIYFEGQNSRFFYNLANLRKKLRIKLNVEMLYLADEMFKQRNSHFTVVVGESIPWQTFNKSKNQAQWAQWVRAKVYQLKTTTNTSTQP